jgi:hypothetical protein
MKMADMGRAKPKGKDGQAPMAWGGEEEGPRVRLDHDRMKKIVMAKPPATGDEYHIQGHARVVGSREEPASDGKEGPVHSIEIVIHHMGAEPKTNGKSVREDLDEAIEGQPDRAAKGAAQRTREPTGRPVKRDIETPERK